MDTFHSIIGHRRVIDYLQDSIRSGHVSHAYIFNGADGIGKKMTARAYAAALLCREGGDEACGKCISCRQMADGNQPDVAFVTHEKAIISVGDIRQQLCNVVPVKPMFGPYRIFIVDEAEKMNEEAQNALLKTLEEPPSYAVIMLLTNNAEALLPTIRSRAVTLEMLPVPVDTLTDWLMAKEQLPDYRARLAAVYSGGSPGQAIACARSEEFQRQRDSVAAMMRSIAVMREDTMAQYAKDFAGAKEEQEAILGLVLLWLHDLMMCKAEQSAERLMFREEEESLAAQAESLGYEALWSLQAELGKIRTDRRVNVNMETSFWLFLAGMQRRLQQEKGV
ncbi:MAG: DNA polymerase III subunit delta' [Lachnospiraceae bacterium]|nr:DNA polymerase III subunit delta' [Lachnospiraceae bacterium]